MRDLRPEGGVQDDAAPLRRGRARARQPLVIAGSTSTPSRSPLSRWLTILFPVLCAVGFVQNALASGELAWLLLVPPALVVSALLWREWPGASLCGALWFAGC